MAAPLTNPVWIYGDDDDTLFRLIALGTGKLSPGDAFGKLGYRRKGSEAVVGPMSPFGEIILIYVLPLDDPPTLPCITASSFAAIADPLV